jgi:hypothetical protein
MRTSIVNLKGVELETEYELDPAERASGDHPGYPAEARVYSVKVIAGDRRVDITEMLLGSQIEEIEMKLEEAA